MKTLKAEIDEGGRATQYRGTLRSSIKPKSARIGVKVTNHLSDEVMKIFQV